MAPVQTITVPEENRGVRLDRFLVSVVGDQSRSQLQRLIDAAARPSRNA